MLELETALRNDGKEILYFDNAMLHSAAHQYSKHREGYVFMPFGNQSTLPRVVAGLAQSYPLELWKNEELDKHFQEALLIAPSSNTLKNALRQAGFEATAGMGGPPEVVHLKEFAAHSDLQQLGTIESVETHEEDYKTTQFVRSQFE
jgi:hypothetical protein